MNEDYTRGKYPLTTAEKELNQKCKNLTLNCCSWLKSVSTADIKLDEPRYVASTDGAYEWLRSNTAGPLIASVKNFRCS
jgi:hypothetical protein